MIQGSDSDLEDGSVSEDRDSAVILANASPRSPLKVTKTAKFW